jgi:predicted kinase
MEFHILCGIPGSGKSTISKRLSGYIVSTDRIREFLWNDDSILKHDKLVFDIATQMINYMLSIQNNVIFDATNLTVEKRRKYIQLAKVFDANITVHWINCPIGVALSRNSKRERKVPKPAILALYKSFESPTLSEGMDWIKIYKEDLSIIEEFTNV